MLATVTASPSSDLEARLNCRLDAELRSYYASLALIRSLPQLRPFGFDPSRNTGHREPRPTLPLCQRAMSSMIGLPFSGWTRLTRLLSALIGPTPGEGLRLGNMLTSTWRKNSFPRVDTLG